VNRPAGVLFDFDGVIVDSLAVHLRAWENASQRIYGTAVAEPRRLAGRSTEAIAKIIAAENREPGSASTLAEAKRDELRSLATGMPSLPGVPEVFDYLRSEGIPFGIASNAPRAFVSRTLEQLHLDVQIRIGIEDVRHGKPSPEPFLTCAKQLGIAVMDHPRVLVFEDSTHGLRAAVGAGMIAIGVTTQHESSDLIAAGARATCAHLRDALDRGWFGSLKYFA